MTIRASSHRASSIASPHTSSHNTPFLPIVSIDSDSLHSSSSTPMMHCVTDDRTQQEQHPSLSHTLIQVDDGTSTALGFTHLPAVVASSLESSQVVTPTQQDPYVEKIPQSVSQQLFSSVVTTPAATTPAAPSLIGSAKSISSSTKGTKYRYLVVTLVRTTTELPWGLSLCMIPEQSLLLGAVTNAATVHSVWEIESLFPPTDFGKACSDSTKVVTDFLLSMIDFRMMLDRTKMNMSDILKPGDCIVSLNDQILYSFDNSLASVITYLRQPQRSTVTLIVYREFHALQQAKHLSMNHPNASHIKQQTCGTSQESLGKHDVRTKRRNDRCTTALFVSPVIHFEKWLAQRKKTWRRRRYHGSAIDVSTSSLSSACLTNDTTIPSPNAQPKVKIPFRKQQRSGIIKGLFPDPVTGQMGISYCNDQYVYDHDIGGSAALFLPPMVDFEEWLIRRKKSWRQRRNYESAMEHDELRRQSDFHSGTTNNMMTANNHVSIDFWSVQGHASWSDWCTHRTMHWKAQYSWNRRKRARLEQDCVEIVHLDVSNFTEWLRVRQNQWKVQRRKRQRERQTVVPIQEDLSCCDKYESKDKPHSSLRNSTLSADSLRSISLHTHQSDFVLIDALLEEKEREQRSRERMRPPFNINFLFDANLGCPDDTVAKILGYLSHVEHGALLMVSATTRRNLAQRDNVWQQLCPHHWQLPRRPRKPWYEVYRTKRIAEIEDSRKGWDDLLARASSILLSGDHLQSIEKLVSRAERTCQFDINYASGIICERNSLLNLAVIHQRHKVVRWLVEMKNANIESCDRGHFTALLNAAYAGDRYLVRFLMQQGADRSKIGRFHYTKPLSHPEFEGLNAEGWAEKNGFPDVAKLLRYGI